MMLKSSTRILPGIAQVEVRVVQRASSAAKTAAKAARRQAHMAATATAKKHVRVECLSQKFDSGTHRA